MKTRTVSGFYGSGSTPCFVFVATNSRGASWYVVEGGSIVNKTYEDIEDGVDVDLVDDVDCLTWNRPITSEEELIEAIES